VGDEQTSVIYEPAENGDETALFVCAHGAGGNMHDRGVSAIARVLRHKGIGVARFNFLYRERKASRPDAMPRLMATIEAVVALVRSEVGVRPLIIGGRSMGGRAASMLAAQGFDADGLLLLAYPLHPPGKPDQLRASHLADIRMPVLCINGTRDEFCTHAQMQTVVGGLGPGWQMHWEEGADHGFHVLKSSGRRDEQVHEHIGTRVHAWVRAVVKSGGEER
jgi:predicted alpha/beta-hydrolase family hydrolase